MRQCITVETPNAYMPSFDFISNKQFRESLEADHLEMRTCVSHQAWKAAQVTAGSIVEALLVDYLQAHPNPNRKLKKGDPLQLDLGEAVELCKSEGIISSTTADLCSVIRAYRNLIHPGRLIRTQETPPNEGSANIALQLVELITAELSRELQKTVGLTAEQVGSKVVRDAGSVKVLSHILDKFNENQRRRLLFNVFPLLHEEHAGRTDDWDFTADRIAEAHRVVFEGASEETQKAYVRELVRIVEEEDGDRIRSTMLAFFSAPYLQHVDGRDRALLLDVLFHLLPRIPESVEALRPLKGIEKFITPQRINVWIDPLVRTLFSKTSPPVIRMAEDLISDAAWSSVTGINELVEKRLKSWEQTFNNQGQNEKAATLSSVYSIPF